MIFTLKSQSVTRWSCRPEAVKAVEQQLPFIVKALIHLVNDSDPKTSTKSRCLLTAICDFSFVLGLQILKLILSNTASLSKYIQGENTGVTNVRSTAAATTETLYACRKDEHFDSIWKLAERSADEVSLLLKDTLFEFKEATVPKRVDSTDVKGYHRVSSFFTSLDKVVAELNSRFSGNYQDVLWVP